MNFVNRNPIVYNICGKSGSGKSQMAAFIEEYYKDKGMRATVLQYSYYVKEYAKKILGWDGNEKEKPRDFLNEVGVELIKDTIDASFSVRRLVEDAMVYSYFYDVLVISDARFIEEITQIQEKFPHTVTIYVESNRASSLTEKQKKHRTNHGLDDFHAYTYQVENNGTLEELKKKTIEIIKEVENNEY